VDVWQKEKRETVKPDAFPFYSTGNLLLPTGLYPPLVTALLSGQLEVIGTGRQGWTA
jgi:hypothetical protein